MRKIFCYYIKPYKLEIDGKQKTIKGEFWIGNCPCSEYPEVEVTIFNKDGIFEGTRNITVDSFKTEPILKFHELGV